MNRKKCGYLLDQIELLSRSIPPFPFLAEIRAVNSVSEL